MPTTTLRTVFLLTLTAILANPAIQAQTPNSNARPNIIVILSDDMGISDLGCYGGEIQTPNLNKLAGGGLRFTQFYNTARCCPTRASLLTGLYPHQAGVGHMTENKQLPGYQGQITDRCLTIAEMLRPAGYRNYALGKWHVIRENETWGEDQTNWPLQRGFDKYYGTLTGAGSFYDPTRLARDNQLITPANDKVYQPKQFYYTDALSDQAVSFLQEHARDHQDKPFFMYVAYTAAHWPMHALPEDIAKYKGKYDGGYQPIREARYRRMQELGIVDPRWALSEQAEKWEDVPADQRAWEARCMEVYAAMIDRMDQGIGKIMSQLQSQGTLDNTLILFMQDNGGCAEPLGRTDVANWHLPGVEPMGVDELQRRITPPMRARDGKPLLGGPSVMPGDEHTYVAYGRGWANVSNTPLREYKHWVHEGGISTPLVAHWPRGITKEQQGKLFHEPGHLIDIAATCVDLARAKYPERGRNDTQLVALQGKTLLPAFQGRSLRRERPLFWEHEGNRAVRDGEWKLVAKGPKGKWELYNITDDRSEQHDLAIAQPERVEAMRKAWDEWAKSAYVLPWPWDQEDLQASAASKREFNLRTGDSLTKEQAPHLDKRTLTATVKVRATGDGVIVAQGGNAIGYALGVVAGKPTLWVRSKGKLVMVESDQALPKDRTTELKFVLSKTGQAQLFVDGKSVGQATFEPALTTPLDGLQVGQDDGGRVGNYKDSQPFAGEILTTILRLEE